MKKLLFATIVLSGCVMSEARYDSCNPVPLQKCDPMLQDCSCKDHNKHPVRPVTPPVPVTDDPPAVKDPDVCDGGARACRDGEQPTGTKSDPTKYLDKE